MNCRRREHVSGETDQFSRKTTLHLSVIFGLYFVDTLARNCFGRWRRFLAVAAAALVPRPPRIAATHCIPFARCRPRLKRLARRHEDDAGLSDAVDRPHQRSATRRQQVRRRHPVESGSRRHGGRRSNTRSTFERRRVECSRFGRRVVVLQRECATATRAQGLAAEEPRRHWVHPGGGRTVRCRRRPRPLRAGRHRWSSVCPVSVRKWIDRVQRKD